MADLAITYSDLEEGKRLVDSAVAVFAAGVAATLFPAGDEIATADSVGSDRVAVALNDAAHAVRVMAETLVRSVSRLSESASLTILSFQEADAALCETSTP